MGVYIAYLAEQENIDYRMFERDDIVERDRVDDESFFKLMKENNPKMFEVLRESVNETLRKGN